MGGKSAVVLDTNFIFAKAKHMDDLLQELKKNYEVYITQISVDERKEQMCREFEKGYISVKQFCAEFAYITGTPNLIEIDEALDKLRHGMQKKYELAFAGHIIPHNANKELLETVLDRANKKISPFSTDEKASDKGFKDTLIWLSILEYFKTGGESDVIFVSNDGGFRKEIEFLCQEFRQYTGKTITLKDSNFYKDVEPQIQESERKIPEMLPQDINQLREKIQSVIGELCGVNDYDYWGNPEWNRTFTLNERVDSDYMKVVFNHLKQDITNNLFETSVPADKILGLDDRITNHVSIPMESLEKASLLHEEIKTNMKDFLIQFYSAAANIINNNYEPSTETLSIDENDELPF